MVKYQNLLFSQRVSGQDEPNPAIWLVPGAGGIFRSWPTGLKNGWLVKRYYVKSVTELLLSMRVAFSPLKSSIWWTGCSCFSTGTAILFHFQRTIEVTLDSFLIGNAVWIDHWLQWLSKKPFWPPYTGETEYRQSNLGSGFIFWWRLGLISLFD